MSDSACDLLVRGIAAAKAREKDQARFYLEWVLRTDSDRRQKIEVWLWLSDISNSQAEKRDCLENILACEPSHPQARRRLAILDGRLDPTHVIDPNHQPLPLPDDSPQPPQTRQFVCQQCGGKMAFSPDAKSLTCIYCNRHTSLYRAIEEGAMVEEHDFAVALATAKGHSRPTAMRSFTCQTCGVSFMVEPAALSLICPYCESAYVLDLSETRRLIPPEAIIPFNLTQQQAADAFESWLKEKRLHDQAQTIIPAGLYLPAWTFDVAGEAQWQSQVLKRRFSRTSCIAESGNYPIFADDVLIPASHTLPASLAKTLHRFDLAELTPYDSAYLASWPAEIYQIPAADASLAARRQVWEEVRHTISTRASPGMRRVKDLTFSSAGMVVEAFKLVLLPVWIAQYRLQNDTYKVLINGQTGAVHGEFPRTRLGQWLSALLG
jgi:predicted RNA-binding Zn-ribbon protein involved in translation (DUF1610 family)